MRKDKICLDARELIANRKMVIIQAIDLLLTAKCYLAFQDKVCCAGLLTNLRMG